MTSNESEVSSSGNWNFFDKVEGLDSKKMEECFACGICVGKVIRSSLLSFPNLVS